MNIEEPEDLDEGMLDAEENGGESDLADGDVPATGTVDDDDDPSAEREDENEAPVRESSDSTEAPEEFEVDDEDEA
jgi:hypothetical protein